MACPISAITKIAAYAYHISDIAQFGTKKILSLMRRTGLMAGNARIGKPWSAPLFSVEQVQKNTYTAKEILVLLTKKIQ